MVGRRAPAALDQLYLIEFFQYDATPVRRRARRFKPALALSAELITENTQVPGLIPPQPVRAKQPRPSMILPFDGTPARHGSPDRVVNVLNGLNLRLNNSHIRHLTAGASSS